MFDPHVVEQMTDIDEIAGRIKADADQAADIPREPARDADIVRKGVEPYLRWRE